MPAAPGGCAPRACRLASRHGATRPAGGPERLRGPPGGGHRGDRAAFAGDDAAARSTQGADEGRAAGCASSTSTPTPITIARCSRSPDRRARSQTRCSRARASSSSDRRDGARRRGRGEAGQHPHVGALDVAPIVYLDDARRGAACAEALVVADRIGDELGVPVFLYGELTAAERAGAVRTRAELRRGGVARARSSRMAAAGQSQPLVPDFGPPAHASAARAPRWWRRRPPLVAFNLTARPPATARATRARSRRAMREGGEEGLPGVRAIGVAARGEASRRSR